MIKSLESKNSLINPKAQIGKNVKIGDFTKISGNAVIGDNVVIGDWCKIGFDEPINEKDIIEQNPYYNNFLVQSKCVIGKGTTVCDRVKICNKVVIGDNCFIGDCAYIRSNCKIGANVKIGFSASIMNFVEIGDSSLILNYSAIGATSRIGKRVFISPSVMLVENKHMTVGYKGRKGPIVGDNVCIGTLSAIISCDIGEYSVVGANSVVTKDLPERSSYIGNRVVK